MTEVTKTESSSRITEFKGARAISINNYQEALTLATAICKTSFVPKAYVGKPQEATIAMIYGMEVGLPPMASLQNIAVVNGQPSIWGDGMLALVQNSGLLESYEQSYTGEEGTDSYKAIVKVKRKDNNISITAEFSVADAKNAGLWGKVGTWKTHPKRMLMYKARAFALRDCFPDVLKGLHSVEEMEGEKNIIDITNQATSTTQEPQVKNDPLFNEFENLIKDREDKEQLKEEWEMTGGDINYQKALFERVKNGVVEEVAEEKEIKDSLL